MTSIYQNKHYLSQACKTGPAQNQQIMTLGKLLTQNKSNCLYITMPTMLETHIQHPSLFQLQHNIDTTPHQ